MFCIVDRDNNFNMVKSGFKTASQANNWAKKNLPKESCQLWKDDSLKRGHYYRYFVKMR